MTLMLSILARLLFGLQTRPLANAYSAATTLIGPGQLTFGGATFFAKGEIVAQEVINYNPVGTSATGELKKVVTDKMWQVSFQPAGEWESPTILNPYGDKTPGTLIRGTGSDAACVIYFGGNIGKSLTLHNAVVTQVPTITCRAGETTLGPVQIMGLVKKDTAPNANEAYEAYATAAFPDFTALSPSAILTGQAAAAWGSGNFAEMYSQEGWEVSFELDLQPIQPHDASGTADYLFNGVVARVSGMLSHDVANTLAAATPDRFAIGGDDDANKDDFVLSASGFHVTLYNAVFDVAALRSAPSMHLGNCSWFTTRTVSAGALTDAYRLATAAPA